MNINETNYENYFFLYIDKELSPTENTAVENFIALQPTYADELEQLKKTIQAPENILFEHKALLYRLPAMEASISPDFKNKLYKKEARLFKVEFTNRTKAALLSVAALFVLLIGYRFIETSSVSSINTTTSNSAKANGQNLSRTKAALEKKNDPGINVLAITTKRIKFSGKIKKDLALARISMAAITMKETTDLNTSSIPISNETISLTPLDLQAYQIKQLPNEIAIGNNNKATEHVFPTTYQVVDTEEEDRSIYIANLEIDAAALRGISRRFNALFKKNKSENK
jgi:hypothetical protein